MTNVKEQPLYRVRSTITEEKHAESLRFLYAKVYRMMWLMITLSCAFTVFSIVLLLTRELRLGTMIFLPVFSLVILIISMRSLFKLKKGFRDAFEQYKTRNGLTQDFLFYERELKVSGESTENTFPYAEVRRVVSLSGVTLLLIGSAKNSSALMLSREPGEDGEDKKEEAIRFLLSKTASKKD